MPIDPNNLKATAVLTFGEEFNSLNLWNGTSGTWRTTYVHDDPRGSGGTLPTNGELQWYINALYAPTAAIKPWTVQGGILSLTANRATYALQLQVHRHRYVSGQLNTYPSFAQTYGYFEMSAKLPSGKGLWPAFWLLPTDGTWPPEIDVMEVLGHQTSKLHLHVHSKAGGKRTSQGKAVEVADLSHQFHVYGVDWQKESIIWYLDGREVFRAVTPADLHKPMYMLVNLAVGGHWPGSPSPFTRFPADYQIDYVRAYRAVDAPAARASAPAGPASCALGPSVDPAALFAYVGFPTDGPLPAG